MIHSNPHRPAPTDPPPDVNGPPLHPRPLTGSFFHQDTAGLESCAHAIGSGTPTEDPLGPPLLLANLLAHCEGVLGFPIGLNTALLIAYDAASGNAQARERDTELLASQTRYEKRLGFQLSPRTVRKIKRKDIAIYPDLYGKSRSAL